jgi:diguanylate cyclase (GGDEF)-like protein
VGDKAIMEAANVLKETFRTSDIIARLGGDEFAALTIGLSRENADIIISRLQSLVEARNSQGSRQYRLSISVGYAIHDSQNSCSMDDLMAAADKCMYEKKQCKKGLLRNGASPSSP